MRTGSKRIKIKDQRNEFKKLTHHREISKSIQISLIFIVKLSPKSNENIEENQLRLEHETRPALPKVVVTQPSSTDLQPSLSTSIDTIPLRQKKKCCVIL
ncbi:hypothetical protein DICVIV_02286 [Dictyocaulus viviparus]|uniref:Uncharacterized protein n=1 Tax=Dictyocaulus viviparus TaxID=29172 RepID=A0A0D8Y6C6_DICVI|nr:hypothetical protein DICVIV_02286 [Dictyocaulus viviparus]